MLTKNLLKNLIIQLLTFLLIATASPNVFGGTDTVDFNSDRWEKDGTVTEYLGRQAFAGTAILKDVEFSNGTIEVDIAVTGARSYPGFIFRMQDEMNSERFYIRPHRAGLYPDALQYTPVMNRVSGWQLYNGKGYTASAQFPHNEWFHLKMEISGSQAKVFLNNADQPAMTINYLKQGVSKGKIGVNGPKNGSAYFSNFSYKADDSLTFDEAPPVEMPANTLTDWEISKVFPAAKIDLEQLTYPRFYTILFGEWQKAAPEASGLVDIARFVQRNTSGPDLVLARTVFRADKSERVKLSFGYSDEIAVYFNKKKLFYGNSSYQHRDPSFLGIVGYNDAVYLDVEKGLNEIFFVVKETFGGWGFQAKADQPLAQPKTDYNAFEKVWETPAELLTPESALYDPKRKVIYVSSFDAGYKMDNTDESLFTGFISKVSLDGQIENLHWVDKLNAPCGMGIYGDKLYTVERGYLTEIDIETGKVLQRYPVTGSDFLNDLIIDSDGSIYMSDTSPSSHVDSRIYRFKDGKVELWLNSEEIIQSNGLFIHQNKLIVGNSGDGILKSVDLKTKVIEKIACLGGGIIDGIRVDNDGNYLVSHWEGLTFRVTPAGDVTILRNIMGSHINTADFEFIKDKNLLIVPTFLGNKVEALRLLDK